MHYFASSGAIAAVLLAALGTAGAAEPARATATARGTATATVVSQCDIDQAPQDRCGSTTRTQEHRTVTLQADDPQARRTTTTYRAVTVNFE